MIIETQRFNELYRYTYSEFVTIMHHSRTISRNYVTLLVHAVSPAYCTVQLCLTDSPRLYILQYIL